MNLILHEAPRLLANILILQPIDERYIWMPTTAILGEPQFCRIRGYISTLRKQGIPVLDALKQVFMKTPILPAL
ncbi:MAG: hypothetical protein NT070_00515 [Cyanobacteria bacterium]|nr:hypothetical protein [Cyanobacteriota bacterium]